MLIEMKISGLTIDPFTNMPIVILKDLEQKKSVPIWIGILEASAIATELESIKLSRPMTHDLLKNILEKMKAVVEKIVVSDLRDNTFFANIHLSVEGVEHVIDARPSDSLALALRTGATIWVDQKVVDKSQKIDIQKDEGKLKVDKEKWEEILENMDEDDFGKYKM